MWEAGFPKRYRSGHSLPRIELRSKLGRLSREIKKKRQSAGCWKVKHGESETYLNGYMPWLRSVSPSRVPSVSGNAGERRWNADNSSSQTENLLALFEATSGGGQFDFRYGGRR